MSRQGLTPTEAARVILADAAPLAAESVELYQALDRVLTESIVSPIDIPAWDNSAMDGYAVRGVDVAKPGVKLRIVETVAAGQFPAKALRPGESTRIFTGAPLPQGSDGVIRQEDTTPLGETQVQINDIRDARRNVRYRGEDIKRGEVVFDAGTSLGAAHLGVLASLARPRVSVHRRPCVAILGSGDEIAELDEAEAILAGTKIASSNSYTLSALLSQNGADVRNMGIAKDDPADLRARLSKAMSADVIVTTAGVSVGEHDHVRTVLEELGLDLRFWRIRMRPGAPVGYGLLNGRPWIGLPGNPVSTMVTFELFVRPLLRRLSGHDQPFRRSVTVRTGERIVLGPKLRHFLRAIISEENGALVARLTGPQGSGILTSMARANALLIVPETKTEVAEGEQLDAIRLDETVHLAEPAY